MSLTHDCGKSGLVLGGWMLVASLSGTIPAEAQLTDTGRSAGPGASILGDLMPESAKRTAARSTGPVPRKPLARLVRNPDTSGGLPEYALADQTGAIQRYVEPVPGIDLDAYVGYAVIVRHDTGRTLLASQLELPGQENGPSSEHAAGSTNSVDALFKGILDSPADRMYVQPAQYMPNMPTTAAPVVIQDGAPMTNGPTGGPPMMMDPRMMDPRMMDPRMMDPQGVVVYDPMNPNTGGMPWNAYQSGSAPIYLDGPAPCGPQGCPTPNMYMPPGQPCPPTPPAPPSQPPSRWSVWGDVLWIHPTGIDMAHAQQQDGLGGAGTVPFGVIGTVDPGYDLGFRLGGELRFAPKESVFVTYTWFESDSSASLAAPVIPGGGGAVGSLVHHPGAALTASAGPVNATYDIDFQLGDAAYRHFISCTRTGETTVFIGARYGNLEQSFTQQGIFGGGLGGAINTTTSIDFDGGGPMAGVTGERLIGQTRFSAYGRALVAALSGSFRSQYRMVNQTTDVLLAESIWQDDRIVPMLDYELGIAWTGPQGHFRLAAGYMASFWFNAVTTPVFVDAVQADNYVNVSDTIAFDGLVGRVEVRW